MSSLEELRRRAVRFAGEDGRTSLPVPGAWVFRASGPTEPKRAETSMVTFAAVLQGRKQVGLKDRALSYAPGQYLFVTGERKYLSTIEDASPERPYLSIALQLAPEALAEVVLALADAGLEVPAAEDPEAVVAPLEPAMRGALARLLDALDDPVGRAVLAPLAQRELLVHLLRGPGGAILRQAAAADDGRIRRAVAYLDAHAGRRVTVEEVARHVAMSPSHFAHRFRQVVRMSPIQYLKHVRLQRARLLMLGNGLGAAEAGASVGYASASHFARDFKGYFGAPPARYVQQFRLAG